MSDEEQKDTQQQLTNYLKRHYLKIIGWILFFFGLYTTIIAFFEPVNFIWGPLLLIIGAAIVRKELKTFGFWVQPYLARVSPAGPALLVLGIIFLIVGLLILFPLFLWGILLIIIGLPLATSRLISKHHVQQRWSHFIGGGQGRAEDVFTATEQFLKDSGATWINIKREKLIPSIIRGMLAQKREFLVIKDTHFRLRPYQFLLNARDYGNNLDVVWYLTYRLSLLRALVTLIPFVSFIPKKIQDIDLFDEQDLTAYGTVCHHAVLKAVEKIVRGLDQDVSKIDRSTRGFLGIS